MSASKGKVRLVLHTEVNGEVYEEVLEGDSFLLILGGNPKAPGMLASLGHVHEDGTKCNDPWTIRSGGTSMDLFDMGIVAKHVTEQHLLQSMMEKLGLPAEAAAELLRRSGLYPHD